MPTPKSIIFKRNPKPKTENGKSSDPSKIELFSGDGTVTTESAILPGIKWADDFEKGVTGAKPVKFVEVCSIKNQREDIFEDDLQRKKVEKNGYIGVKCSTKKNGVSHLNHNGMLKSRYLLSFMLNAMEVVEENTISGFLGKFKKMSFEEWDKYEDNCSLLN